MESYDKIRKMGDVSKQLKKFGLAEDTSDAQKKAEELIMDKKKDSEYYATEQRKKEMAQDNSEIARHFEGELKRLAQHMNDKFTDQESQINIIRDKMNEIIAKINELEGKINAAARQEVQAKLMEKPAEKPKKQEEPHSIKPEVKKAYSSDDVSIDKVFYVGRR